MMTTPRYLADPLAIPDGYFNDDNRKRREGMVGRIRFVSNSHFAIAIEGIPADEAASPFLAAKGVSATIARALEHNPAPAIVGRPYTPPFSDDEEEARIDIGEIPIQLAYFLLVERLFGECEWRAPTREEAPSVGCHALIGGRVVAVVLGITDPPRVGATS